MLLDIRNRGIFKEATLIYKLTVASEYFSLLIGFGSGNETILISLVTGVAVIMTVCVLPHTWNQYL